MWRQKEQFTDGVGYNWLDSIVAHCESSISDTELKELQNKFNNKFQDDKYPITNKEEAYYRKIFEELFPNRGHIVPRWIPQTVGKA